MGTGGEERVPIERVLAGELTQTGA